METLIVILLASIPGLLAGGLLVLARWRGEVAVRREREASFERAVERERERRLQGREPTALRKPGMVT